MGIMPDRFNSTSAPDIGGTLVTSVVPSVPAANYVQVIQDPFEQELRSLINRYSKENGSNTPDFQLAKYLLGCLELFDQTVNFREAWFGRPAAS